MLQDIVRHLLPQNGRNQVSQNDPLCYKILLELREDLNLQGVEEQLRETA